MRDRIDLKRRQLLRGRSREKPEPIRPPWSCHNRFTELCTRCGCCGATCPEHIIVDGDGGFPEIDFARGECTFCGACSAACSAGVFDTAAPQAWTLTAQVSGKCLSARGIVCRSCVDACAEEAITITPARGGSAKPHVVAAVCTGCGACVSACPVRAIGVQPSAEVTDAA